MLREDDHLAAGAPRFEHLWFVLKKARQLFPLTVVAGVADLPSHLLESSQCDDLSLQLLDRLSGRCLVDDLLFEFLQLRFWPVIDVLDVFGIDVAKMRERVDLYLPAALSEFLFPNSVFKSLTSPLERLVDRFWGRGKTTLEDGKGESDDRASSAFAFGGKPLGPIHFLSDVVRDFLI